jgi:sugar lactone lactonase YvrE
MGSAVALAVDHYQTFTYFGTPMGSADGKLKMPIGITVGPDGNIYVADANNHRFQKFDNGGNYIKDWGKNSGDGSGGAGNGEFSFPHDVALDSNGNIYVSDTCNNRIQKFSPSGIFVGKWGRNGGDGSFGTGKGEFHYPMGLAIDANDNVYVADYNNHRIQKFKSSGQFVQEWGSLGTGEVQFQYPYDIAIDSVGNIFASDNYNHRIQKLSSSGKFISQIGGTKSSDNGKFNEPAGLDIDAFDNLYVADSHNNRVQKFNSKGIFITKFGTAGTDKGQFNEPMGVAVMAGGQLYVSDSVNHRVQILMKTNYGIVADDKDWLTFSRIKKTNTTETSITANLDLVTSAPGGSHIAWASSNASIVATDGKVTRPALGSPDVNVKLTATITNAAVTDTKVFNLIVKSMSLMLMKPIVTPIITPATPPNTPPNTPGNTLGDQSNPTSFSDVAGDAWYKTYVEKLVGKGIISGYSDGTFRPGASVTRAEFSKMLSLALGWNVKAVQASSFSDVPLGNWASPYVEAAKLNNAINGYPDGMFGPSKAITRAEIAATIARVKGYALSPSSFTDTGSHWADSSIGACAKAGMLSGYPGGIFKPNGKATRAEAAKLIGGLL